MLLRRGINITVLPRIIYCDGIKTISKSIFKGSRLPIGPRSVPNIDTNTIAINGIKHINNIDNSCFILYDSYKTPYKLLAICI